MADLGRAVLVVVSVFLLSMMASGEPAAGKGYAECRDDVDCRVVAGES